jgi:hypothetical protein
LVFQHKYYLLISVFCGYVVPLCVAGIFWNDWKGGITLLTIRVLHCRSIK